MDLLIFLTIAAIYLGVKLNQRYERRLEEESKPHVITKGDPLEKAYCNKELEQSLREQYPKTGEVTEERLELVRDVAREILLGEDSTYSEEDLERETETLARKYVAEILLVKRDLLPARWTYWMYLDRCEERVFLWGFHRIRNYCSSMRVVGEERGRFIIYPAGMKRDMNTYYRCPRPAMLAMTKNAVF